MIAKLVRRKRLSSNDVLNMVYWLVVVQTMLSLNPAGFV
jgi:hypothetical protein